MENKSVGQRYVRERAHLILLTRKLDSILTQCIESVTMSNEIKILTLTPVHRSRSVVGNEGNLL